MSLDAHHTLGEPGQNGRLIAAARAHLEHVFGSLAVDEKGIEGTPIARDLVGGQVDNDISSPAGLAQCLKIPHVYPAELKIGTVQQVLEVFETAHGQVINPDRVVLSSEELIYQIGAYKASRPGHDNRWHSFAQEVQEF